MTKTGRNDICACGSGKKYKQCCLHREQLQGATQRAASAVIPRALQEASEHHRAGRMANAEAIGNQILQLNPHHPQALLLLGVVALQMGRNEIAVERLAHAIRTVPSNPYGYLHLGDALRALGIIGDAVASYRKALEISQTLDDAHVTLGNALAARGMHNEAIVSFQRALKIDPRQAETHYNLGNSQEALGKRLEAIASYRQATLIKPGFAEAHNNLGKTLKDVGQLAEAKASFQRALELRPDYPEAHNNLGNALRGLGQAEDAIASYRRALAFKPDYAVAHNNLGFILAEPLGQFDAAIASFHRALELEPNFAEAHYNLGVALGEQEKPEAQIEHYQRALALRPDYPEAYSNLLFIRSYKALISAPDYLAIARGWELACIPALERQAARERAFARPRCAGRRLRVGYLSGDFRQHAVAYFIEQLFAEHDRNRIELFAYSTNRRNDTLTSRLEALAEHWIPVTNDTDGAVRDRIEADGIDVLVDLSGHTAHNRMGVFGRRAAPVQAHYLGYFASTGLTEMDYWIGDEILTPPHSDNHFCEQVWRLPRAWVCYKTLAAAPMPAWRPAADGTVWLGSFNSLGKITPATIALWARILHALPEGKLLLKNQGLSDAGNRQRLLDALQAHGVSAERIELQSPSAWADYMAQYDRLDIALDPIGGHGGGTSTCDALWMGVPVIHALGERTTSRFAASLLHAIGHPEWIAHNDTAYVDKVVALARDVDLRTALRASQRDQMARSPLCDAKALARHLEDAYYAMFERWLERRRLVAGGNHARLEAEHPPVTLNSSVT